MCINERFKTLLAGGVQYDARTLEPEHVTRHTGGTKTPKNNKMPTKNFLHKTMDTSFTLKSETTNLFLTDKNIAIH
jgi:hypothetical protein